MKESGSVINNNDNVDSELQPLDEEEHEARNMENSTFEYLKRALEIESDGSSLEKLEYLIKWKASTSECTVEITAEFGHCLEVNLLIY